MSRSANDSGSETDEEKPHKLDGYNTEPEYTQDRNNIDIHRKWLEGEWDENDREFIGYTKKMWLNLPEGLQGDLLNYVTEDYHGKDLSVEKQKQLIHELVTSYHKGRNGKNNKYGHAILNPHRPCCTECVKSCMGKLCGGKTYKCKECKWTLLRKAFNFQEGEKNNAEMKCKPPEKIEGGYKRTRRRRKKNRKKRTKKKARRKRRRKSSNRRRRRKR